VGEVAAACAAGMLPLDTAARLIVARSRHQARTHGEGRMAALGVVREGALVVGYSAANLAIWRQITSVGCSSIRPLLRICSRCERQQKHSLISP
jgi:hypothetical protein